MQQNEKKIQDVWIAIIEREIELFNCQFLAIMRCGIKTHHRSNAFSIKGPSHTWEKFCLQAYFSKLLKDVDF